MIDVARGIALRKEQPFRLKPNRVAIVRLERRPRDVSARLIQRECAVPGRHAPLFFFLYETTSATPIIAGAYPTDPRSARPFLLANASDVSGNSQRPGSTRSSSAR